MAHPRTAFGLAAKTCGTAEFKSSRDLELTYTGDELTGLFQAQATGRRGYPAFALSSVLHGLGVLMVSWALLHNPTIVRDPLSRNYKVRHLQLDAPETAGSRDAEALYPNQRPGARAARNEDRKAGRSGRGEQAAEIQQSHADVPPLKLPEGGQGKQMIVQPEIKANTTVAQQVPLPTVLIWTPPELKKATEVAPPVPDKPNTVNVQTSLELPNEELEMADLPQSSTERPTVFKTAAAGNSSPVAVKGPEEAKTPPSTVSKAAVEPTSAPILTVSDLRMDKGTVALPPVNETKGNTDKAGAQQSLQEGTALGQSGTGEPARVTGSSVRVDDAQDSAQNGSAAGESAEHIQLPQDGRFGVVVLGAPLSDQYPETLQVWSDRVAYTAYLHVGTPKAWILQYAQLRSADAAGAGAVAHLDAPWPYDILRPNLLSKDLNADALMVHGVLNEAGRLVNLAIAYPEEYAHGSFVLHELGQWKFRPAEQKGKATAVEVLLIIPEND